MRLMPWCSRLLVPALTCLLAALTGCRGGGVGGPVSAGSSSASKQVASALFVEQWGQILWGLVTSQTGTETPSFDDPVFNPDGSVTQRFTTADGTVVIMTTYADGSGRLDITWPDGSTQTVLQSVPEFDGVSKTTIHWTVTSSDGLSVNYTSVVDDNGTPYDISDDTTELQGSSVLPEGLTQDFTVVTAGGQTIVQANQSDGSSFTLTVPLAPPTYMYPDFSGQTAGAYDGAGLKVDFTLDSTGGAGSRWAAMSSDLGGGVAGQFSVNADFSGSGQLTENGQLMALLSWTSTGDIDVRFVTGEHSDTWPAGAAVDYLVHRWQTLAALMAPAPGITARTAASESNPYRTGISLPRQLD